jgi:hypothetical protein
MKTDKRMKEIEKLMRFYNREEMEFFHNLETVEDFKNVPLEKIVRYIWNVRQVWMRTQTAFDRVSGIDSSEVN